MKTTEQRGFAHIGMIAVIVLVIGAVGGCGYFVAHKNSAKKAAQSTAPSTGSAMTASGTGTGSPSGKAVAPASSNKAYLTIHEWGVRIPISSSGDVSYAISSGNANLAEFTTKALLTEDSGCTADSGGAGMIARFAPGDKVSEDQSDTSSPTAAQAYTTPENHGGLVKVGNFFYGFHHAQGACGTLTGDAAFTAQDQANKQIKALLPELQAAE